MAWACPPFLCIPVPHNILFAWARSLHCVVRPRVTTIHVHTGRLVHDAIKYMMKEKTQDDTKQDLKSIYLT